MSTVHDEATSNTNTLIHHLLSPTKTAQVAWVIGDLIQGSLFQCLMNKSLSSHNSLGVIAFSRGDIQAIDNDIPDRFLLVLVLDVLLDGSDSLGSLATLDGL